MKAWSPADATDHIRAKANSDDLDLRWTLHVETRMEERNLVTGDLVYLLKNGFVYDNPEVATNPEYFKYTMVGETPNSGNRALKVIVIPGGGACLKIVTVMWRDER